MVATVTPPADCQADGEVSASFTAASATLVADSVCSASAWAGKDHGEQASGVCQATGAVSSTTDGVNGVAAATGVVSATFETHTSTPAAVCQATGVVSAEQHTSVVANDRFEMFHSITEGVFDFTTPVDTWASPGSRELSAATYGAGTHYFVLRRRNKWGLSSQNIIATKIVVLAGVPVVPPPSMPLEVSIAQVAGNIARIQAAYYLHQDGDDQAANQWLLYVTIDGSDPKLATPIVTDQGKAFRGVRDFEYNTAALSGNLVRTVLKTRRRDNDGTTHDSPFSVERSLFHVLAASSAPTGYSITPFDPTG